MKKPLMLTAVLFSSILPFASFASAQPRDWGAGPWGYGMHYMWGAWGEVSVSNDLKMIEKNAKRKK